MLFIWNYGYINLPVDITGSVTIDLVTVCSLQITSAML